MWPLSYFESNGHLIPEVDNLATWDGVVTYLIAISIFFIFFVLTNKKRQEEKKGWFIVLGVYIIVLILLWGAGMTLLVVFSLIAAMILTFGLVISPTSLISNKRLARSLAGLILCMLVFTFYVYVSSYAYFLPASYPPEQRDQLRMIRRIVEVEPHFYELEKPVVPLSEAHLVVDGKELIPDSIRNHAEYQGYRYIMKLNYPYQKLYILDVVPIHYTHGMPSFHVFPTNPEEINSKNSFKYLIYCATMSDKSGLPATEKDRHFHHKSFWQMLFKR